MEKQKLDVLQVGRGCSALAVVAYHAWLSTQDFLVFPSRLVNGALSEGFLGVDFFFVLSGFIILQVHGADARTSKAAGLYARKRLARIYVPYLPIGAAMAIAYTLSPTLPGAVKGWSLLTSLTLIPSGNWPALSVAWTLEHELMFYGFFLLFFATRRFPWVVGGWAALIALTFATGVEFGPGVLGAIPQTLLAPINLEFIFGMAACLAWRRVTPRWGVGLTVIGAAWLCAYVVAHPAAEMREAFGLGVAILVTGSVALERVGWIRSWPPLVILGNASYAIYLVHDPVISITARLMRGAPLQAWMVIAGCIASSLIAGFVYHLCFEEPTRRFLAGVLRPTTPKIAQST